MIPKDPWLEANTIGEGEDPAFSQRKSPPKAETPPKPPPDPKIGLKITKITILPCRNGEWQFKAEHQGGKSNHYGYLTAQEAARAAAVWAIRAETDVEIEFEGGETGEEGTK